MDPLGLMKAMKVLAALTVVLALMKNAQTTTQKAQYMLTKIPTLIIAAETH